MAFDVSKSTFGTFEDRAVWLIEKLLPDFPKWEPMDAFAVCGNLGRESGIQQVQEGGKIAPSGGYGLPQWTGPRRAAYMAYCARTGRDYRAMQSGYDYLFVELRGQFSHVIDEVAAAPTIEAKVAAFEQHFEMAGVVAEPDRLALAVRAKKAWEAHVAATPAPKPAPAPTTTPAPTKGQEPMPSTTPAPAASAPGTGISLATIKRMLDNLDDEIDAFRDFPFIGKLASSVALLLDPVRKAVDSGVLDNVRKSVDQIDNEISRLAGLPFLGGFIGSIATVTHKLRVYVDAADPASLVAAPPA